MMDGFSAECEDTTDDVKIFAIWRFTEFASHFGRGGYVLLITCHTDDTVVRRSYRFAIGDFGADAVRWRRLEVRVKSSCFINRNTEAIGSTDGYNS